jgi:hypothetical protein
MKLIHSYGAIGLGDFVSSTSFLFTYEIKEDSHIIFHVPKIKYDSRGYEQRVIAVLNFLKNTPYNLTYEFDNSDIVTGDNGVRPSGPNIGTSFAHFMKITNKTQCKFVYRHGTRCTEHVYWPSKIKWEANQDGPIGIYLNHEYQEMEEGTKFFNEQDNLFLQSLIDDRNYFSLGYPRTFEENVDIMAKCRYVIGLEGGWTHVSNSMRIPYIICANQRPLDSIKSFHSKHPNLQIIDTQDMHKYLVL